MQRHKKLGTNESKKEMQLIRQQLHSRWHQQRVSRIKQCRRSKMWIQIQFPLQEIQGTVNSCRNSDRKPGHRDPVTGTLLWADHLECLTAEETGSAYENICVNVLLCLRTDMTALRPLYEPAGTLTTALDSEIQELASQAVPPILEVRQPSNLPKASPNKVTE